MPLHEYVHFSANNFANNDHFIDWCLDPTDELNSFWEQWTLENPDRKEIIDEAKSMVLLLHKTERKAINLTIKKDIWNNLDAHINKKEAKIRSISSIYTWRNLAAVAASFLFLFFAYQLVIDDQVPTPQWVSHTNTSGKPTSITLSDQSIIDLAPNSTIQYYSVFDGKRREVILQGEAFFKVERDTTKPFLIYANQTITKVLGTSFTIKANNGAKTVEVEVATGRVAVFSNTKKEGVHESPPIVFKKGDFEIPKPNARIDLKPNEKITYDNEEKNMIKSIIDQPQLVKNKEFESQYTFKNAPITEVFSKLEMAYGIQIEYDMETLNSCSISTELDDAPMFTKLEMICTALDLKYEEKNAIIYIDGLGCD